MSKVIIGNHGGTWGIEHAAATPEALAQAKEQNYWGTLLVVDEKEAAKVVGQPLYDEFDDAGNQVAVGQWPKNATKA